MHNICIHMHGMEWNGKGTLQAGNVEIEVHRIDARFVLIAQCFPLCCPRT